MQKPVARGAGPAPPPPPPVLGRRGGSGGQAASGGNGSWARRVLCAPGKGAAAAPPGPAGLPPSSGVPESPDSPHIPLGESREAPGTVRRPAVGSLVGERPQGRLHTPGGARGRVGLSGQLPLETQASAPVSLRGSPTPLKAFNFRKSQNAA